MNDLANWAAPSPRVFERMARTTYRQLPAQFREMCGDVIIRVEDFPSQQILEQMGLRTPFDLLGLYHGVSLDKRSVNDLPHGPDLVFLYRRPILDYWAGRDDTLGAIVCHVLVHEIGHHFGLSDADMEAIEAQADDG